MPEVIRIKGMGLISGLGRGIKDTVVRMREKVDGISPISIFPNPEELPVCQIADIPADTENRNDELAVIAIREALMDANLDPNTTSLTDCALLLGNTTMDALDWEHKIRSALASDDKDSQPLFGQGSMAGNLAVRVANRFGINDIVLTYSTSCTSSANALYQGMQLLLTDRVQRVLVVGTESLTAVSLRGFSSLSLLSPVGCFPFDKDRAGLLLGEGAAAVILEKEEKSIESLDPGEPVLMSGFNGCDLSHPTSAAMDGSEGARAMESAIRKAGIRVEDIIAIKTHGTGSQNNDLAEGAALTRVFGDKVPPFVSLKRYFGHTLGASGALELVAFISCIKEGFIPASLGFSTMDPELNLAPLTDNAPAVSGHYLFNSFGFGGNMVSLVVHVEV